MADRFSLNRAPGKNEPKYRAAYQEAQRRLAAGCLCDDCKENTHLKPLKAVSFALVEAPPGDFDFFVVMLCEFHANLFVLQQVNRQLKITADKSQTELVVTDTKIIR
jgi:hypothetical protein